MNNKFYCGIDVSKKKLDVVLLADEKPCYKVFKNDIASMQNMESWLLSKTKQNSKIHICMEATNVYHLLSANYFSGKENFIVSVANPRKVKNVSKELTKTKNDKVDAKVLAIYCEKFNPARFIPPSKERMELKELTRHLDYLVQVHSTQKVRLQTIQTEVAARGVISTIKLLENSIAETEKEIKNLYEKSAELGKEYRLLKSIPSFGERICPVLLANIYKDETGKYHPKKLTSFFGLDVIDHDSGTSVKGKKRISKFGNPNVRKLLYMSALVIVAKKMFLIDFYNRLVNKGKPKKVALIAMMRKLLVIACAILNSGKPFEHNHVSIRVSQPKYGNIIYCNAFRKVAS